LLNEVPVPLTPKRLEEKDIDLIVDILKNNIKTPAENFRRKIKVNGKDINNPLTDL
jgi:hypothetical protein